ncbi:DUF2274 domain-containing protein [Sphingomonas mali]|uniref:DUF2274 domain-containing protein n=1 Tax=Sphingomonas mali TaxID=40682 RepID=UPI00083577C8|nr:DUF2274 domain-containing protein [Sphingomonas mali]
MAELKLARIPDRTPIKLTIAVPPETHQALGDYAAIYAESYGREEPLVELIPAILAAFLDADREFQRRRSDIRRNPKP